MYTEAKQDAAYSEINVEDPSPGFQQLRDSVDLQLCVEHGFFQAPGGAFDLIIQLFNFCIHAILYECRCNIES